MLDSLLSKTSWDFEDRESFGNDFLDDYYEGFVLRSVILSYLDTCRDVWLAALREVPPSMAELSSLSCAFPKGPRASRNREVRRGRRECTFALRY